MSCYLLLGERNEHTGLTATGGTRGEAGAVGDLGEQGTARAAISTGGRLAKSFLFYHAKMSCEVACEIGGTAHLSGILSRFLQHGLKLLHHLKSLNARYS